MRGLPSGVGKFIVIEGPDYCGKGTQSRLLVNYLLDHPKDRGQKSFSVVATREPTGSPFGRRIRELFASLKDPKSEAETITQLFFQDRRWHIDNMILPGLKHAHVVCDRFMYSTIAYQQAQGIDLRYLLEEQRSFIIPHLTILILPSVEQMIKRKAAERDRPYEEVFEKSHDFMAEVRGNYARMKEWLPDHNIVVLDGDRTPQEIFEDVKREVDKVLF
jgi:dTMP kinase